LSHGSVGIALLHIERAHQGTATWEAAHSWLSAIARHGLIEGDDASLFLGAPAMAFALHLAAADSRRYVGALRELDTVVAAHTRTRLDQAHARIDRGERTSFAEYDVFRGLTGLGALLLRRDPDGEELHGVLSYLVRLTEPLTGRSGEELPGWWVAHGPSATSTAVPGGHGNAGMAHGIAGPLALLALAKRRGVTVDGHTEAMLRICAWLDALRQDTGTGTWWPQWITRNEHPDPHIGSHPTPLSWCYGTPGLVRAQQLAGIALGDSSRQRDAEQALLDCLSDTAQLARITGRGLCHGAGGLLQVVQRVAQDARNPAAFTAHLPWLRSHFLTQPPPTADGFLEGMAGAALAFRCAEAGTAPASDWDACLLIT